MRILRRYIRREVAVHAALGLLLFTFVIFMQDLGRAMEAAVRANPGTLLRLIAYVLPAALVFTLPMALLVGLLIGLGRLSADRELMALEASGVGTRRLLAPLLQITALALGVALVLTLWLAPAARRQLQALTTRLATSEVAAAVQPRVFFEPVSNPNWVIYTGDIGAGGEQWRHVLVAQMQDPSAPELTLARSGTLIHRGPNEVQLHLIGGTRYKVNPAEPATSLVGAFRTIDIPFLLPQPRQGPTALSAEPLGALWQRAHTGADWRAARVEYYRRWALAFACLALALVGIALGLRRHRGSRASGFVLTLGLVLAYYLAFILGLGLAKQGKLPPFWGAWAANLVFLAWGGWALWRLDRTPPRDRSPAPWSAWPRAAWQRLRAGHRRPAIAALHSRHLRPSPGERARSWMPSLLGAYVVREFLLYTCLLLAAFVVLVLVSTLFELIGSILQNHISVGVVAQYLIYFTPQMLYLVIPVAILVGVLIAFGLLSKSNEITAMKASGISIYRLLVPVLLVAGVLCAFQFALGATWLPVMNQRQDALHAVIKGQPPQTFRNPERKWVFGRGNDIYYFRFFDLQTSTFDDLSVFQFDPARFQLTRRIFAQQARWDPSIGNWVFTNGWARGFGAQGQTSFETFVVASFPGLRETPPYFATDSLQGKQMGYSQLRRYVADLRRSGYNVSRLSITLSKKIAYPLITLIMALLAFPFALTVGRRGTVAGVSVAIAVAIAYWSSASLLEALGRLNQLPAPVAAWTPDLLFLGLGVYLLLRVPT